MSQANDGAPLALIPSCLADSLGREIIDPGTASIFSDNRILIDGSAALSWHLDKMAQGRAELPALANNHLVLGTQAMWQDATQVNYFGVGPDSLEANRSQYRMQTTDAVAYATVTPADWLSIGGEFGFLKQPKFMAPGETFVGDFPETRDAFRLSREKRTVVNAPFAP